MSEIKHTGGQNTQARRGANEQSGAMRPAVDIFEDDTGITLQADMPGVSRERLEVHVDSDSLTVEGRIDVPVPEGMEARYADVHATRYQRSFTLSSELDREHIEANLKDGVLTIRIPKPAERKPRRIDVRTG